MSKQLRPIKVCEDIKKFVSDISFELSNLERKNVSEGEVVKRAFKGEDILPRLRQGAMERRSRRR